MAGGSVRVLVAAVAVSGRSAASAESGSASCFRDSGPSALSAGACTVVGVRCDAAMVDQPAGAGSSRSRAKAAARWCAQGQCSAMRSQVRRPPRGDAGGGVQDPVAQRLGFGVGEFAVQHRAWVHAIRSCAVSASSSQAALSANTRRGSSEARSLCRSGSGFRRGRGRVQPLDPGHVAAEVGGVADAEPLGLGELQLGAGVWALAADDHSQPVRTGGEIQALDIGDLGDLRALAFPARPGGSPDAKRPRAIAGSIRGRR